MAGVRRKVLAKSSVPTQRATAAYDVSKLTPGYHWHCCSDRDCRLVFLDECSVPEVNGRCDLCTRGHDTPYMQWKYPKDCCYGNCELLAPKSDWIRWSRLAGPGPWYQCSTCKRIHGWPLA